MGSCEPQPEPASDNAEGRTQLLDSEFTANGTSAFVTFEDRLEGLCYHSLV